MPELDTAFLLIDCFYLSIFIYLFIQFFSLVLIFFFLFKLPTGFIVLPVALLRSVGSDGAGVFQRATGDDVPDHVDAGR